MNMTPPVVNYETSFIMTHLSLKVMHGISMYCINTNNSFGHSFHAFRYKIHCHVTGLCNLITERVSSHGTSIDNLESSNLSSILTCIHVSTYGHFCRVNSWDKNDLLGCFKMRNPLQKGFCQSVGGPPPIN